MKIAYFAVLAASILQSMAMPVYKDVARPSRHVPDLQTPAIAELDSITRIQPQLRKQALNILSNNKRIDYYKDFVAVWDLAFTQAKPRMLEHLLKILPQMSQEFYRAYLIKSVFVTEDVVRILLNDGRFRPDVDQNVVIRLAASRGMYKIVGLLMEDSRVDPSAMMNDAIIQGAGNGRTDVVKQLMSDPRVDPSDQDNKAVQLAIMNHHFKTAETLVKDKRVVLKQKYLYDAIDRGDVEAIKWLLTRIKPTSQHFLQAVSTGNIELVELLLLDGRIDPEYNNNQALDIAEFYDYQDIIRLLRLFA